MRITVSNDQFKSRQQISSEMTAAGMYPKESESFQEGQVIKAKIKSILNEMLLLELSSGKTIEAKCKNIMGYDLEKGGTYQFVVKAGEGGQVLMKPLGNEGGDNHQGDQNIITFLEQAGISSDKANVQLVKLLLKADMPVTEKILMEITQKRHQYDKVNDLLKEMKVVVGDQLLEKNLEQVLKALMKNQEQRQSHGEKFSFNIDNKDVAKNTGQNTSLSFELKESEGTNIHSNTTRLGERVNIEGMTFDKIIFLIKNGLKVNLNNATSLNDIVFRQYPLSQQFEEIIQGLMKDENTIKFGESLKETVSKMQDALMNRRPEFQEVLKELYAKAELIKIKLVSLGYTHQKDIVNQLENVKNNIDFLGKLNPLQTFLQVPIEIGNVQRNLDLFIVQEQGRRKKINPKDVKVLVSLETKNMAFVQVLIEIKEKSITCNFRVENEHVRRVIQSYHEKLEGRLKSHGFTNIYFHYAISQNELYLLNTTDPLKDFKHHSVDIKV